VPLKKGEIGAFRFFVIASLLGIIYLYFGRIYVDKQSKADFDNFNSAEITGTISEIGIAHHMEQFKVNTIGKNFIFNSYTDKRLNNGTIFNYFAEIGDSIVKHAYTDTLFLIKKGKTYKYLFGKPNRK